MSTSAIRCPYCFAWMRVAVQASQIKRDENIPNQLHVRFDDQSVAHICRDKEASGEEAVSRDS